jgi:hypothetical protein
LSAGWGQKLTQVVVGMVWTERVGETVSRVGEIEEGPDGRQGEAETAKRLPMAKDLQEKTGFDVNHNL